MYRGTTPQLNFELDTELDISSLKECYITFKSGNRLKSYGLDKIVVDDEKKVLTLLLEQEDTLFFGEGELKAQIRFKLQNEQAYATNFMSLDVQAILKDGVI